MREDPWDDTGLLDCGHLVTDLEVMTDEDRASHAALARRTPAGTYGWCVPAEPDGRAEVEV